MTVRKILKFLVVLTVLAGGLLFIQAAFAQFGVNEVGAEIALPAEDPRIIAAKIIRIALGFLGIIALAIVLYGGFVWMTSAGNPERIDKAKKILTNGAIGLIIIVFAFGITQYILNKLLEAAGVGRPGVPPTGPPVVERLSGALGNGIIESHYPPRGATGVPRNIKIIVTFKEPMSRDTLLTDYNDNGTPDNPADDWGKLNDANIKIYKSIEGETGALAQDQVKVTFTTDLKIFVFDPIGLLGSPSENIWYTVALKPGIKKSDGSEAFTGAFRDGYLWDFEVSTFVDTTPPQVESVVPAQNSTNPRNVLIQINFNEAMDPTTVSGKTAEGFDKIVVKADDTPIDGVWEIGNQYKTVEFRTNDKCGTNSCGGDVFCLPANATITVTVKAATLGDSPPEALWPYDGTTDVVGNSLDGDRDGTAEGPATDNYEWSFSTNDTIDLTPPQIEEVTPAPGTSNVRPFNLPVEMRFSKLMSITSFNTENIILEDNQRDACAVWFTLGAQTLDGDNNPIPPSTNAIAKHKAIIYHGDFIESVSQEDIDAGKATAPICTDNQAVNPLLIMYYPRATHNVKDLYQNCFFEPSGPGNPPSAHKCVVQPGGTLPDGCEPWKK